MGVVSRFWIQALPCPRWLVGSSNSNNNGGCGRANTQAMPARRRSPPLSVPAICSAALLRNAKRAKAACAALSDKSVFKCRMLSRMLKSRSSRLTCWSREVMRSVSRRIFSAPGARSMRLSDSEDVWQHRRKRDLAGDQRARGLIDCETGGMGQHQHVEESDRHPFPAAGLAAD